MPTYYIQYWHLQDCHQLTSFHLGINFFNSLIDSCIEKIKTTECDTALRAASLLNQIVPACIKSSSYQWTITIALINVDFCPLDPRRIPTCRRPRVPGSSRRRRTSRPPPPPPPSTPPPGTPRAFSRTSASPAMLAASSSESDQSAAFFPRPIGKKRRHKHNSICWCEAYLVSHPSLLTHSLNTATLRMSRHHRNSRRLGIFGSIEPRSACSVFRIPKRTDLRTEGVRERDSSRWEDPKNN